MLGRCGPIDNSRSEIIQKRLPGGWVPHWKGLYFDPATWDGSDIFQPEGTGYILVVESVKRALVRAKVKNLVFKRLDEIDDDLRRAVRRPGLAAVGTAAVAIVLSVPFMILAIGAPIVLCVRVLLWFEGLL